MPFFLYASFPNSRLKNRNPTVAANTWQTTIANLTEPLTLVAPANLNRTYVIIKNLSDTFDMWYIYSTNINFDPSVIPTFGVVDQLLYNNITFTLYQKQSDGIGVDWVIVQMEDVAERVEPFQSASLESLENIYCLSNTTSPIVPPNVPVVVGVDEGRG